MAKQNGCRGWAAWRGHSRVEGWQTSYEGPILSITKALAGLAVTRAASEGWLDPTEHVADTIREWRGDARKQRITLQMLLQQTAGLEAGVAALYRNPADKGRNAVALRAIDEPGSFFRYGPACSEVLAELMQRKLSARGESLERYLHRSVMVPIGLGSKNWRSDKKGRFFLSTGAELSVDELGKLGRTIGGLLRGESPDGFDSSHYARVTRASAANPMFGGGLWRNAGGREIEVEDALDPPASTAFWQGAGLSRSQPRDFYALIGSSGRRVYIWPREQVVIARHGVARSWRDGPFLRAL
ncbi:serine hydrolase [Luteolibacter soli]|uniref:Serine hydrolase n=1 Tax=Luteolibacter soli TaxID=3135280 RepID=A0ABU9AQ59_9BACT